MCVEISTHHECNLKSNGLFFFYSGKKKKQKQRKKENDLDQTCRF
jgi:hypothetical protein